MPSPFDQFLDDVIKQALKSSEWEKYFSIIPRRTITGKLAIGRMNRRMELTPMGPQGIERDETSGAYVSIESYLYEEKPQYATDKELFTLSLQGKNK